MKKLDCEIFWHYPFYMFFKIPYILKTVTWLRCSDIKRHIQTGVNARWKTVLWDLVTLSFYTCRFVRRTCGCCSLWAGCSPTWWWSSHTLASSGPTGHLIFFLHWISLLNPNRAFLIKQQRSLFLFFIFYDTNEVTIRYYI
jgi:hypothetical protein